MNSNTTFVKVKLKINQVVVETLYYSNTTFVKVKLKAVTQGLLNRLSIQIQHLLKLNERRKYGGEKNPVIQIQHLLKLNN